MWEEGVGHVLVEEGCAADEVECYSIWTIRRHNALAKNSRLRRIAHAVSRQSGLGSEVVIHFHSIQLLFLRNNLIDMRCQ